MAAPDVLAPVGLVYSIEEGREVVHGSCFAFRFANRALTAAHVVLEPDVSYRVNFPRTGEDVAVLQRELHPVADAAALLLDRPGNLDPKARDRNIFWDGVRNLMLGEQFESYGYPVEGPGSSLATEPVPRFFMGYYQRYFEYNAQPPWRYVAGEMSIPAPGGLSGAPLFRPGAPTIVTAIVTANAETYTIADSYEQVEEAGRTTRFEARRVISYGVACLLFPIAEWLNEQIPPREGDRWII